MTTETNGSQHPLRQANTLVDSEKTYQYSKHQRLLTAANFTAVFNDAQIKASHPNFLILARINQLDNSRLGLVIAKKHVKRAVDRNIIKRAARESFRLQQHKVGRIDAIVLARRGAGTIPAAELRKIFNGLWKRISKRNQKT